LDTPKTHHSQGPKEENSTGTSHCRYQDANRLVLGKLLYGPMELDPHKLVEHRIATVWKWGNTIINNLNGDIQV